MILLSTYIFIDVFDTVVCSVFLSLIYVHLCRSLWWALSISKIKDCVTLPSCLQFCHKCIVHFLEILGLNWLAVSPPLPPPPSCMGYLDWIIVCVYRSTRPYVTRLRRFMFVFVYLCICVCMFACMDACMHACICVRVPVTITITYSTFSPSCCRNWGCVCRFPNIRQIST